MRLTIVIPTYWGRESREPFHPEDAVYDHPTPLDEEGTLARALESIRLLDHDDFRVVVVAAVTHPALSSAAEEKVSGIVEPFRACYPLALFTPSSLEKMKEVLRADGEEDLSSFLSLRGYSNIRNTGIFLAFLTGAEAAVLFDDDEVYEDPFYLRKVEENIGSRHRGYFVGGMAGYYVNRDGGYLLPEQKDWVFSQWPAVEAMNRAFAVIEGGERLAEVPWVFGGNMIIHRELGLRVCFDPRITRGEDIDYLINARFLGYRFFLDRTLWIRHLPPPKRAPLWRRFREDLDRFVYTREKLRSQDACPEAVEKVSPEDLDPYPGRFLRDDLEDMIFKTSVLMGLRCLSENDGEGFAECMANIGRVHRAKGCGPGPLQEYMSLRARWERGMRKAVDMREPFRLLESLFDGG